MKISILVPVYNVEQYIRRCIESIFVQTFENLEIIIVNDASPDTSISIVESLLKLYPSREKQTKIINNVTNFGISKVRNIAIKNASGEYIYFVDSDDYLLDPFVISKFAEFAQNTNADIIEGNTLRILPNGKTQQEVAEYFYNEIRAVELQIAKKNSFTVWNKLIKRSLFSKHNILFPNKINYGEDYATMPIVYYYSTKTLHVPILSYAYNLKNTTSFFANRTNWNNLFSMIDSNRFLYNFFKEKNEKLLVKYVDVMYLETMVHLLLNCRNKCEIKNVSEHFTECHYRNIIAMRPKFALILSIYFIGLHSVLLRIGRIYRKR